MAVAKQHSATWIWNNDIPQLRGHYMLSESRPAVTISLTGEQALYIENHEKRPYAAPVKQTDAQYIFPTRCGSGTPIRLS